MIKITPYSREREVAYKEHNERELNKAIAALRKIAKERLK